ncbi:nesprin-2 isoform X2 [Hippocampus comes]|uniref:nesprin-2 isoform X2 n=1 Tax=Hippocampus comes TaxID=109280 RepID=UPI00094E5ACF|nr:PREDICTED: nesprin-2-like isoform X2 [Hippocampus comes]
MSGLDTRRDHVDPRPEDHVSQEEPTDTWGRAGDPPGCDRLERRWLLWHGFMTEHAHLDAWLRLAEQAVASHDWTRVTYAAAKDDVGRFERLRCEAGSLLVHLDALTQRNRTLTALFHGAMRTRLLAAARDCGRRWDRLNVKLESISGRLKALVREWEEFEEETEELAVWLAEMEVGLAGVQHVTGKTCDKLRQLQSFQRSVCANSGRVNGVLERGEALILRGAGRDAQCVERRLLELLRQCSHVYGNIARAQTRLLSMRLVFEDDFLLTPPPDSGCPSETFLFEEEGALDKVHRERSPQHEQQVDHLHRRHCPSPPSPFHEHLGLEWDPSVDVGHSGSCSDFSYCSASTGPKDTPKMRSYISSLSSEDNIKQEDTLHSTTSPALPDVFSPESDIKSLGGDRRATSTPKQDGDGRVRAWLGSQGALRPSCCKAVQTDAQCSAMAKWDPADLFTHVPSCHGDDRTGASHESSPSRDTSSSTRDRRQARTPEEEDERGSGIAPWVAPRPGVKCLLLAAAVSLLACLFWSFLEAPCGRSVVGPSGSLHLRYVNGPPPT